MQHSFSSRVSVLLNGSYNQVSTHNKDIVDVLNAIKLMIAYRYFTALINEDLEMEKLNRYIDMAEGSLMGFSSVVGLVTNNFFIIFNNVFLKLPA